MTDTTSRHARPLLTIVVYVVTIALGITLGVGAIAFVQRADIDRDATISSLREELTAIDGVASVGVGLVDHDDDEPWRGIDSVSVGLDADTTLAASVPVLVDVLAVVRDSRWENDTSDQPSLTVWVPDGTLVPLRASLSWRLGLPSDDEVADAVDQIERLLAASEPVLRVEFNGGASAESQLHGLSVFDPYLAVVPVREPEGGSEAFTVWNERAEALGIDAFTVNVRSFA